jgi:hypothetical protein
MIKSIFASFFTFIFSIFFFISFLLFVLLNTLLDVDFYKGDLSEAFYETTVEVVSSTVVKNSEHLGDFLTEGEVENALREIVKPEDFEDVLVPFISQIVDPVFDEQGKAVVSLNFSGLVDKFPEFSAFAAGKLIDTLPECEGTVLPTEENACVPQGVSREDFGEMIFTVLDQDVLSSMPSELKIFEFYEEDLEIRDGIDLNKDLLWKVWWMSLSVLALLLIIIALIILKPWHRVVRWLSKPLIASSLVSGILFLVLHQLPSFASQMMPNEVLADTAMDKAQVESMIYFIGKIFSLVAEKALLYVAVVFLVGLILLITGIWGKHHDHE